MFTLLLLTAVSVHPLTDFSVHYTLSVVPPVYEPSKLISYSVPVSNVNNETAFPLTPQLAFRGAARQGDSREKITERGGTG